MACRRGMGKGKGKGYYNIINKDKNVHSDSARGRKQPQTVKRPKKLMNPNLKGYRWVERAKKGWKKENFQNVNVFKKLGNWDIGLIQFKDGGRVYLMVRGLDYGETPIIYPHQKAVGYDRPELIPDRVKEYIYNNAEKIFDLRRQENNKNVEPYMSSYINERKW